jgi:tetratricopeptide (TPR) repeat protein
LASYANAEAEVYCRQVLELSPADDQKATCLAGLGEALSRQGRRDDSIQVFRQGIDLYLELGEGDAAADLYARLSQITWRIDYLEAWNVCQEGLKRLEGAPEGPGLARLLAKAGWTAHFQAKPTDEVVSLCQRAIEIAERLGEVEAKADASITIALATDDIAASIKLMQEGAAFSVANGLWFQAARAYNNLGGEFNRNFHSAESAHQHFLRAVDFCIKIGDIEGLLFVLGNLAISLGGLGHLNTAEDQLTEILRSSTVPQSRVDEFLDKIRSLLLFPRGEWTQALEFFRCQREEHRQAGRLHNVANYNLNLASVCLELNRFESLADLSEAEAAIQENAQMDLEDILSRLWMVILCSRQERLVEARERLAEVIDDLDQPISKQDECFRFWTEAELAREEGRWDEAVSAYQELIDIYQEGGYRWRWARQLIDLGDALIGRNGSGDRERAEKAYREALEMFTDMGAPGYVKVLEERLTPSI